MYDLSRELLRASSWGEDKVSEWCVMKCLYRLVSGGILEEDDDMVGDTSNKAAMYDTSKRLVGFSTGWGDKHSEMFVIKFLAFPQK
jgi:hypothetical protein